MVTAGHGISPLANSAGILTAVRNFVETKPLVFGGKVYFGSWGNDFYALDAATGKRIWTWNSGASNRMFSPAACWPVASGNKAHRGAGSDT